MNYKDFFEGKKITMMGLGTLGRGVNVAKFLAECGAKLTITDLKTEEQLAASLKILSPYKDIDYVLGRHEPADFRDKDMIIKAAGVPLDSPFIEEARKNNIPVEMDASLFAKLVKLMGLDTKIIGVTGTRGKSTTTHLIYQILREAFKKTKRKVYLGGNVKGLATLPLIKKVKDGDIVVMELDSWQLQGFGDAGISPHVSVFTSFYRDHMNYYKEDLDRYFEDKSNIIKNQKEGDLFVIEEDFFKKLKILDIRKDMEDIRKITKASIVTVSKNDVKKWKLRILGDHNMINAALAAEVCRNLGVKEAVIKKVAEKFNPVPGRLQLVRTLKRINFYNDSTATTPDAVIASLKAVAPKGKKPRIILIGGGADKMLEYEEYAEEVKDKVKALILFRGAASNKIIRELRITNHESQREKNNPDLLIPDSSAKCFIDIASMKDAVRIAKENMIKGDVVILSPGAASFGVFKNEYDREEQFNKEIKKLK
ncbi:UDP-N-acetylmuramoyl-L-alanine--D-glutamate ligase [Candidatus Parcubacteria bacterium]|nr:MAG: UDP-N-acetylmuramoyl-L-alanine--D-glutamate ligase [Candidatus Parcubacteria bacterium]